MLVLNCQLGGVRGLFCKVINACRTPLPWAASQAGRPRVCRLRAARVCRTGDFVFYFPKELEIVF